MQASAWLMVFKMCHGNYLNMMEYLSKFTLCSCELVFEK